MFDEATTVTANDQASGATPKISTPQGLKPPLPLPNAPRRGDIEPEINPLARKHAINQGAVPKRSPVGILAASSAIDIKKKQLLVNSDTSRYIDMYTTSSKVGLLAASSASRQHGIFTRTPRGCQPPLPSQNAPQRAGKMSCLGNAARKLQSLHGEDLLKLSASGINILRRPRRGEIGFSQSGSPLYVSSTAVSESEMNKIVMNIRLPGDRVARVEGKISPTAVKGMPPLDAPTIDELQMLRDQIDALLMAAEWEDTGETSSPAEEKGASNK